MTDKPQRSADKPGVPANVVTLGWVSFCTDLATEMLYPVMPLFLVGTLGASPALLGLVDGLAEGVSSGLRWLGGALSDRSGKRKPFVLWGYGISALSKPIMGLARVALGWPLFLAGRISDRFGKSIRTAARDALIADSTEPQQRGAAFGLHRAMDTCGAICGPLATLAILIALCGPAAIFHAQWNGRGLDIASLPLQWLFYIAVIPGLCSVILLASRIREIPPKTSAKFSGPPPIFQSFGKPFWILISANAVFSLGNSSDSFLILRSGELGLSFGSIILAFAAYNCVYALGSYPLGHLSDRWGRKPVVTLGWLVYAAVYAAFAVWHWRLAPWILLSVYGLYQALSEGVTKAMVSDLVPSHQRAGAIGMFYTVSGVCQLIASLLAGVLWNVRLGHGRLLTAFAVGATFALLGAILMGFVPAKRERL